MNHCSVSSLLYVGLEIKKKMDLIIYRIKLLWIDEILSRGPYSNMSAVVCSDYIWETGHCSKLHDVVGLFTHHFRNSDVSTCQFNYENQFGGHDGA